MNKIKICLYFPPNKVTVPLSYHLIKNFDLQLNILHADIDLAKTGKLIMDVLGEKKNIEKGLKFIEQQGIKYKIFNKTIIWQEDKCIHCGACTAVCPSGALKLGTIDCMLTFDKEECLVCELCIKSCPLNVMSVAF
ncbi:MAG: 4Fe-4S binding protein [Bacteroidales bacterium]|nr:4Fe-4S binding protein [Bacteroidales bacterium]